MRYFYVTDMVSRIVNNVLYEGTPEDIQRQKSQLEYLMYFLENMVSSIEKDRRQPFDLSFKKYFIIMLLLAVRRGIFLIDADFYVYTALAGILYYMVYRYAADVNIADEVLLRSSYFEEIVNMLPEDGHIPYGDFFPALHSLKFQVMFDYFFMLYCRPVLSSSLVLSFEILCAQDLSESWYVLTLPMICDAIGKLLSLVMTSIPYQIFIISFPMLFCLAVSGGVLSLDLRDSEIVSNNTINTIFNVTVDYPLPQDPVYHLY